MTQPFAEAAMELYKRGWHPFPVPANKKAPPPEGYTGNDGVNATEAKIREWMSAQPNSNLATRAPANVIGIDVDQYGEKQGGVNLAQFRIDNKLERLPRTVVTSSKPYPSGIHWFQIGETCPKFVGAPVSGVEIVQFTHRFAVMPPSIHPSGEQYRWVDVRTGEVLEAAPYTDDLPWLPWPWIEALTKITVDAEAREAIEWEPTTGSDMDPRVRRQLDRFDTTPGGRHDAMCEIQMALVRYESLGIAGSTHAIDQLRRLFVGTVGGERDGDYEFDQALDAARDKVSKTETVLAEPFVVELATAEPTVVEEEEVEPNKFIRGMLSGRQILEMEPPDPMVGDWLDKGMVFTMVGSFGSAKTFALLDMAMSVTTGAPWLGQPIHHTGPVIYVVAEGGYTIGQRISGWLDARGEDFDFMPPEFKLYPDRVNLLDAADRHDFIEACKRFDPSLVIIDTMAQSMPGGDENSSAEMSMIYESADRVRKATGASVGFARHTGHSAQKRGRGFSGFDDNSDVMLALTGQVKDGPVQLTSEKQKRRDNPPPMWLNLEISGMGNPYLVVAASGPESGTIDERIADTKTAILSTVRRWRGERPLTREEWLERTPGAGKREGVACFMELADAGWFVLVADGLYEPVMEMFK